MKKKRTDFCINNLSPIHNDPKIYIAPWQYSQLPQALGCKDWFMARFTTNQELDKALQQASTNNQARYIGVVTNAYASSQLALKLHESVASLYGG